MIPSVDTNFEGWMIGMVGNHLVAGKQLNMFLFRLYIFFIELIGMAGNQLLMK